MMTATETTYANRIGYTDVEPHEVIRTISETTIEVRQMKATRDPSWKQDFRVGGFFGHTANNNSQQWIIESDESAPVIRLRRRKNGNWHAHIDLPASNLNTTEPCDTDCVWSDSGWVVARMLGKVGNAYADARLIAAAPDLLAACEGSERVLQLSLDATTDGDMRATISAQIDDLRSAIAKAKGGAA